MKIYKFNNTFKNVYVIGDIHGNFSLLKDLIMMRDYLYDCIMIVAGDSGFGFYSYEYYDKQMTELNMKLLENNINLFFVRGNHDDPSYFEENKIKFSNVETIPDYSIIQVGDDNILCVGGGVSIDRLYRQKNDANTKLGYESIGLSKRFFPSYWPNELPNYDADKLNELKENGITIDYVISHTSPSFCFKVGVKGIESWIDADENLFNDLRKERQAMDNIYEHLINDGHPLKKWVYGHFHAHNDEMINNIRFITLQNIEYSVDIHFLNQN
jgi:predicted phosphodiesterase